MNRKRELVGFVVVTLLGAVTAAAEAVPARGTVDPRVRTVEFVAEQVYRLRGYVGYQIDLEFQDGEAFLGLGSGDLEGLAYFSQDNHLFLKPKAGHVATNLTVLTNRRRYQFDYTVAAAHSVPLDGDVIYALRFTYPLDPTETRAAADAKRIDAQLLGAASSRPQNADYWYCGMPQLRPVAASDDGVHTRLRFAANADLPAVFVRNDDGSESLLNFSVDDGDFIIHRVARRFILRRGRLTGCVVNQGFVGGGVRLESGTVAPGVQRRVQGGTP